MKGPTLTPEQRATLATLAADAHDRGLGWATAVARASVALQEAGVSGEIAFCEALRAHEGLPPRWAR